MSKPTYEELQAQVEALRKALEYADNKLYILTHNRNDVSARLIGDADKAFKVVRDALSQSAAPQHLAEVKAQAVMEFVEFMPQFVYGINEKIQRLANQYAEQIRREVE